MTSLIGEWEAVGRDNLSAILTEIGAPEHIHREVESGSIGVTLDIQSNELFCRQRFGEKVFENTFVLGKEMQELTPDGRIVLSTVTLESDVQLSHRQKHGFTETVIVRELIGDQMVTTVRIHDSTAKLYYKRVGDPQDTDKYFSHASQNIQSEDEEFEILSADGD
ncbi:Calycin domain-containing protein [Fasciolopsis buskii]|uniref:Calycin domain-containing protein n=1 Tax=Fasciolopsis buskii TaxID=27845 RepID=A0A8E0RZ45_9TREM|nr:Calycin domain-containing protein [Fasciolopsis buski]